MALTSNRFFVKKASVHEERVELEGRRFFLSENGRRAWRDVLEEAIDGPSPSSVAILAGPEGGWTPAEEEFIKRNGCEAVSLGSRSYAKRPRRSARPRR